jgi:enoyl-CoA hydratase
VNEFVSIHVADGSDETPSGVATLLLARPPTNALTRQLCRELTDAANDVGTRPDVTAVILFGGHEIFSVGSDVPELRTLDPQEAAGAAEVCRRAVDAVAAIPKPTVAAVTGYALGSGLTLALAADWRVSGDNAKFGSTEILDGLTPADGGPARLARAVGESKAKDLVFSGRFAGAEEALAMGLVDELVAPDHVYDAARTWALRFAEMSPQVLAAAKAAFAER